MSDQPERLDESDSTKKSGDGKGSKASDRIERTKKQIEGIFKAYPSGCGFEMAYALHHQAEVRPKVSPPLSKEEFEKTYTDVRVAFLSDRRKEIKRRRTTRRNFARLNEGYVEPEDFYDAEEPEFQSDWRDKSIAEDVWKAEYYQHMYRWAKESFPEVEPMAAKKDRLSDIYASALRQHTVDQNRPVLTHELADFENPYMMKRSALERVLQEKCLRNQLDERVMHRVLDSHPDLVKMKMEAPLPPEVIEPLAAFRGDVRWSFDARERLAQKLEGANAALDAIKDGKSPSTWVGLPENAPVDPKTQVQPQGPEPITHPWRNHIGFKSQVPTGDVGGTRMGQPVPILEEQVSRMRYPTLQRVAHTLPSDPKWRAHVVRSIRVLERSRDWDFASKVKAINQMKEVYDQLKASDEYTSKLDDSLPLNRVPSHLKKKFARDEQYVKTFRKYFRLQKSFTRYRRSLTAVTPMKVSSAKMNFKQF